MCLGGQGGLPQERRPQRRPCAGPCGPWTPRGAVADPVLNVSGPRGGSLSRGCSLLLCHPHLPSQRWARAPGSLRERPEGCDWVHDPPGAGRHHSQRPGRTAGPCSSPPGPAQLGCGWHPSPASVCSYAASQEVEWGSPSLPQQRWVACGWQDCFWGKSQPGSELKPPP